MKNRDIDKINNLIDVIKNQIAKDIDEEYTEYKNKCLQDLEYSLEAKRNQVVQSALNGIDICIASNEPYAIEPTIMIRVEKKIIMKEN